MRVLPSEGSSLTAREVITALGRAGHELDVMDPDPGCLARFSRWVRRVVRCPPAGSDPVGYLRAVAEQLGRRRYDVLLPTHEQAYLFAAMRDRLPDDVGLAVSSSDAFSRVQSKVACAALLDELGLPQPDSHRLEDPRELERWRYPYWLKVAYSTAGQGVRQVRNDHERAAALAAMWPAPAGRACTDPGGGPDARVRRDQPPMVEQRPDLPVAADRGRLQEQSTDGRAGQRGCQRRPASRTAAAPVGRGVVRRSTGFVVARLLAWPGAAAHLAGRAVEAYSVTAETVTIVSQLS